MFSLTFFTSPSCDPSGYGEGETYLTETSAMTDASGKVDFQAFASQGSPTGHAVTALATSNHTSEFSKCLDARYCGDLSVIDRRLTASTFTGTDTLEACRSITAEDGYEVQGDLTLRAGERVVFGDGFSVRSGGKLTVDLATP